jgi:hypothetical protein
MYEADASSFEDAAHHVHMAVQAKDFKTFVANCSQRGVLVVARYADFKYIESKGHQSAVFDFNVSADATLTWADERAHFDRNEIRHSLDFHKLFDQFCEYVGTTYWEAGASTKVWDQWHERMLCDVVSGKMSSNFFWYIYFVKESGQWKVWRIECAVR